MFQWLFHSQFRDTSVKIKPVLSLLKQIPFIVSYIVEESLPIVSPSKARKFHALQSIAQIFFIIGLQNLDKKQTKLIQSKLGFFQCV